MLNTDEFLAMVKQQEQRYDYLDEKLKETEIALEAIEEEVKLWQITISK